MANELREYETRMQKTLDALTAELANVRAGRANPAVLKKVAVDYYGCPTPIDQMAQISVPDARTLVIQPWDASTLKNIERAILASDLGLQPQNDGKLLRILFPQPTEERRRELTKQVAKLAEDAKVAVRNVRRDANEKNKKMKKDGEITEDELKRLDKDVQDLTDRFIKKIDEIASAKEKEIMEI